MKLWILVSVAALATATFAQNNPLKDPGICGRPVCKEGGDINGKFRYNPGTQHNYKYLVNVSTLFLGTSKNESNLYIECSVDLAFVSHCDGILTISDVKLRDNAASSEAFEETDYTDAGLDRDRAQHANSEIFAEAIAEHPLRFAFQDGIISEVCSYDEEKNWVLNFKKGLLSMFHNSMKRFDIDHETVEEDVRGKCKTSYKIQGINGTSLIIEKSKDLSSCQSRSKLHSMVQSTPYNFKVNNNGESLLKSRSYCELSIDHYIYNEISCEESHVFEPFSNQAAGATTIVKQRLILLGEQQESVSDQPDIDSRSSLLYGHVPTPKPTSGELKTSRDLIKKLCKLSTDDVQTEFSDLFTKFIHTSRVLSHPALSALYSHAATLCSTGKKHVLDALPYLGSNAAIALMKDIILTGSISDSIAQEWMLAIALIPRPDSKMLTSMYELLQKEQDTSTVLAVSSITYTFCKQNDDCRNEDAIEGITQLLEDGATDAYKSDKKDRETQEKILVRLKAISNIGLASDSFKEELSLMIEDSHLDVAIRVAAIDTHRRLPCQESRSYFEDIFRREDEDSEVRIAAYLQVMRCPNYIVMRTIKHSLENEQVNQVGSFIWSHLHNLLKSSIPSRIEIQGLLSDKELGKKFSSDVRKFSHNYEGSVFLEDFNVGANYESNLIFSPSSYVPRSAMLNLTVDLFGESINFLEVYGRMEGFEHYLESTFGPKGPYSTKKFQEKLPIPKMRWARDAKEDDLLISEIDKLPSKILENSFGSPKVSLGMKLFGNELKYATFNGDEEIKDALRTLNPVDHLKRILSGKEINYNKAAMFLDTSYVLSSGAGLPVTLNAIGTTAINIQLRGSFKANNFLQNKEFDLTGNIKPSIAVDIVGTMSVDAYYATTGIKLKTNMYTSSAIEGHAKMRGANLISVKFGIPKKTTEIFGARSELIVMKGNEEEEQSGLSEGSVSESVCSWPAVDKTVGLKLCADYHFTNVTGINNASYFILAGPAGFRLSLQKSDPTATTYLLEYKWNEYPNSSHISLTFDTPGSMLSRVLGANLTIDKESKNLTLLLQSTEGTVLAHGKYKNTDAEKYLQVGLDINNQTNFEALLSLEKEELHNGIVFHPKFYLGIKKERVAELQGTVKLISKLGISQYDVDLKFKTKKLSSKLYGYISRTNASISSTLKFTYKFLNAKEHIVMADFWIANRSTGNIFVLNGEAQIEASAYPNYNFNSTFSLQKSGGHIEFKFILNSSPHLRKNIENDLEMLTMELFLNYRTLTNGTRFTVSASVNRPSTELDVKGQLSYDVIGYSTNALVLARYAKGKDIVVTVYWYHPRLTLEHIEGRLNVTIPSFNPMILEGKLKERNSGDYMIELQCTWFSGDSVDVKGVYQDKSSSIASNHHLKLVVQSSSFNEINADCYYYRNNTEIKIDIKADQNGDQYALYLKHIQTSPYEITSLGKLKYKTKLYSITSSVSLKEKREISLELHIDQLRDIYLSMWVHNKEAYKEAGFEVKWDANRDPNQKLAVTVYYANPKPYNYEGNFYVSYPGRTIKGLFNFTLDGGHFGTTARLAWSPDDAFAIGFAADYKNDIDTLLMLEAELYTPFDEWKKTSLNGRYHHRDNMYRVNGSMHWQHDQHISIDLFGDYAATGSTLKCEFTGSLDSTVRDIPSLSASIKHSHNTTKVESELHIMYQPRQKIAITSNWQIDEDADMKNLTGTVTLVSPFNGFNKGLLVSKICFTSSRDLRGVANLDLDHREFTASVEGHFKKLTRSMFAFNVTTPMEKFKLIKGRFGLSEEKRYLVAMVEYPSGNTGVELRFLVNSFTNFDVKFNLATPIEFLQQMLIIAKLQREMADFRVGWNSLVVGFSGVWHYVNITDFEYSCKIYTPIDGFEQNGIVAKLIFKEGLDFEVSLKFAENRLGVIVVGKPKPKILKELGIKTQAIYNKKLNEASPYIQEEPHSNKEEEDGDDDEEENPFNWTGYIEVNTLVYPSMTAEVDIDQKGSVFDVVATLTLPAGKAELRDEFGFTDILTMKNRLSLSTPYQSCKLVTSNYDFKITTGHQYLLALDFNYLNGSQWIKTGTLAHYISRVDQDEDTIYNITFHVHSPFSVLPRLDLNGALEIEENAYRTNFSMATNNSDISFDGDFEMDEGLLEAEIATHLTTPILVFPASKLSLKKEFSDAENRIEFHYMMVNNKTNRLKLETAWRYDSIKNMMCRIDLETPFKGIEKIEAGVEMHVDDNNNALATAKLLLFPIDIKANATVRDNDVRAALIVEFNGNRNVMDLNGTIAIIDKSKREINAILMVNNKKHNVNAVILLDEEIPNGLKMEVQPENGGSPLTLNYTLIPKDEGYLILSTLKRADSFAEFKAHTMIRDKFNWDLRLQIETSHQIYKTFIVNAKAESSGVNKSITVDAKTPFQRLQKIQMGATFGALETKRHATGFYALGDRVANFDGTWSWLLFENMKLKLIGNYQKGNYRTEAVINAFYVNPNKTFTSLKVGGNVDLNKNWAMGTNLTVVSPSRKNVQIEGNLLIPKPHIELHTITGKFYRTEDLADIEYLGKYRTMNSHRNYGSSGNISYHNRTHVKADVLVEWDTKQVHNYVDLHQKGEVIHALYKLRTPKFQQEAVIANATYLKWTDFHNVTANLFYPGNRSVANGHLNFKELANMNGFINVTTPFKGLNYTGSFFSTETTALLYNRYVRIFWPNNDAFLDSKCISTEVDGSVVKRHTKGLLLVEVPLATRHTGRVDYEYNKEPLHSTGKATVEYNKDKILEGKYNCLSESRAGFDKDTIHVELENKLVPVGADYIHGYEYSAPGDGSNTPTVDSKHINVYQLHNRTVFNVTGDLRIHTTDTGQEITLVAIHSNRTVKLNTKYDVLDQEFKQYSRLELGPSAWIAYDLDILNKTTDETSEAQQIQINLSYPRRNFTALGSYSIRNYSLSSEMSLVWDKEGKTVQAGFDWERDENHPNHQKVLLELKHPSFEKNVSVLGEYKRTPRTFADIELTVDYSVDPEQLVKVRGFIEDYSNRTMLNYTYGLRADHKATNLQLDMQGGVHYRPRWYYSNHHVDYKRTYLPIQSGEATTRLDLDNNEIELKRKTLHELSYLWGRYAGKFPLYTANVSAIHGKDINASGEFYLNFREKLLQLELNMTTDGSQSVHMYGYIPDARSAYFDIWRDYEDIRVSDVAYFLRMNHSRLIVASLKWRPDLKQDIKDGIKKLSVDLYNDVMDNTEYWRQYIRSETADTITGIWQDAKPLIQDFLDDVKDLRVIEEDLQDLKVFLNNSYNANEFYIKDMVSFMSSVVDELSIRSHIESLPAIVNEIWEVMGESGKKIQKGIIWVIDKIKSYYKNAAEFINGLFQGDSVGHLSDAFKELIEKYDNFIKEMHVSFIRYMEQLWTQTYKLLLDNWHKTLAAIEPTFLKMIHYLETIAWNASKELLDFLYIRKSEIIENPYFSKISNFTHDVDRFYKDITGNDTIGSIYKYTKVAWNFLKEKYFKLVPFGKELKEIIDEIVNEVNELKNLPSIHYLIEKYNEYELKAKWFYDYFDVENKIHRFITLIHLKLTDMKQTALEAENRYREAKTKFIFEPADGIMHLEQKLPMSWHAFNETPKFEEIPEYKTINDIQNYFTASKMTFSNFFYDYKPFTDPSDWLPPFEAQAMLVGSQYYITFDRKVYEFAGSCSYLLASDFLDGNFSMAISYKEGRNSHELLAIVHDTLIRVDVSSKTVKVRGEIARLPLQIGDAFLYQEAEIVKLESEMGFKLHCNMKFDVCMFEVSGWYFGKTAGLWGTMNNEPSDDLLTPNRTRLASNDIESFASSWSLGTCSKTPVAVRKPLTVKNPPEEVNTLCESFFNSSVSPFSTCFPRVPNLEFYSMCLKSSSEQGACSIAVAYMKLCSYMNTPLRIPDACVKCNLVNGTVVSEGEFVYLKEENAPNSADVVFIVEAKGCNSDLRKNKKIDEIVEQLDRELISLGISENRYSVVVFGGSGVYDRPRSLVINSTVFAEHQLISSYFDHIPTGNGSLDIYSALSFASNLIFRPGVSKTFILVPCSSCRERNMKLDYAILHQLLLENDITLHILMNEEFRFKKTRMNKILFGVDKGLAYTKKDADELKGDATLRKSVQLPKSTLGYCTLLALETNGTVFSGKKLEAEKLKSARKIVMVFAKRVARSAVPNSCKTCECTGHNTGISYMECFPCTYPTPMAIDYGIDEDEMLSVLQPPDIFDYTD